jgi:hypothetical protein
MTHDQSRVHLETVHGPEELAADMAFHRVDLSGPSAFVLEVMLGDERVVLSERLVKQ